MGNESKTPDDHGHYENENNPRCKPNQGAYVVVDSTSSGSDLAWSVSSRNCECLATRGRWCFFDPSLPNQVRRSSSSPVFASSSGNISRFQNQRGQGRRRSIRGRCTATDLKSWLGALSSSRSRGRGISDPGQREAERVRSLRKHQRRPSSFERSRYEPCSYW